MRQYPALLALAHRYFLRHELELLRSCSPLEQGRLFFQIWTYKEAFVKALGVGLGSALHQVRSFISAQGKLCARVEARKASTGIKAVRLRSFALGSA